MIAPKSAKPEEPTVILAESTLVKYVGKTIAWLRRKFPNHPDFVDLDPKKPNDVPEWWTTLKQKFSKDVNDFQERLDSDYIFGGPTTRPLYFGSDNYDPYISFADTSTTETKNITSQISLKYVIHSLMSKSTIGTRKNQAGPLEQRLRMAVTYNNIGRPGENKFVDMRNWEWHSPHELFNMLWQEVKTGTIQAMLFTRISIMLLDQHGQWRISSFARRIRVHAIPFCSHHYMPCERTQYPSN